jgi:hypothetical protein
MLETSEEVAQYLTLQAKTLEQLQFLAERLSYPTSGSRQELIERLSSSHNATTYQFSYKLPQLIAMKSGNSTGAMVYFQRLRKQMFGEGKVREIGILAPDGKPYKIRSKTFVVGKEVALLIIASGWYFQHPAQTNLVHQILEDPDSFEFHIVLKKSKDTNFLMLHSQYKEKTCP